SAASGLSPPRISTPLLSGRVKDLSPAPSPSKCVLSRTSPAPDVRRARSARHMAGVDPPYGCVYTPLDADRNRPFRHQGLLLSGLSTNGAGHHKAVRREAKATRPARHPILNPCRPGA